VIRRASGSASSEAVITSSCPARRPSPTFTATSANLSSFSACAEREIPGAGSLSVPQLQAIAQKSCSVLRNLGPQIQWLHSYVTDNKIYCVYIAPDEATVREHASQGGFPANSVQQIRRMIDPTTAEA
jgi:cell division inhibitor SulA